MATRIVAPLATATKGTWLLNQRLTVAAMPHGFMQYDVLLPSGYSTAFLYPVLFYGPENDEGDSNGGYPSDGGGLVGQLEIDGSFNTVAFREANPCITVVIHYDQTQDESGSSPNSNGGGYNDAPNSGGNEQGVNALAAHIAATYSTDPTRFYTIGSSLGGIACLADLVDNNAYNGIHKIWAAAMAYSDQLFRPTIDNQSVFPAMVNVPFLAISTPYDNSESSYDMPAWDHYTQGTPQQGNYPTEAQFAAGGIAAIKAGSSSFFYIRMTSGQMPWEVYRQMNADGGKGTPLYAWLFSQVSSGTITPPPPPPIQGSSMTVLTPTSGGSITGSDGTVWTMDAAGDVLMNGTAVPGGAGTGALTVVGAIAWGLDGSSGIWYEWTGGEWMSQSGPPPVVPNQVTGLVHGTITNTSVPMTWTVPLLATSYVIQRSVAGGAFADFGTSTTASFTASGLTAGTAYEFQTCGVDSTGRGAFSAALSVTTTGTTLALPGQPTGLTGTVISSAEIDLSWVAPSAGGAVASYSVLNNGVVFATGVGIGTTSYHATSLPAATTFNFTVEAVNATGTGTASAAFSASTPAAGPTKASVQAQITQAEGLVSQLNTLLTSINTNVGLL